MFAIGKIQVGLDDQKPGWAFVRFEDDLAEYYKWFYGLGNRTWQTGINGCHTTFLAGEKDERIVTPNETETYIGRSIVVVYTNVIWTNGRAFWLPALSPDLDRIRVELGLQPRFLYHITLGNIKNQRLTT